MEALAAIYSRVSAVRLIEPGPTDEQIDAILQAGARAPDHGRLAPWRFMVVEGQARERLGAAFAATCKRERPDIDQEQLKKEAEKAYRAPTIIAVGAKLAAHDRVPTIEQIAAASAAAQNMFLAAHAQGLGVMWKTGAPAYDREVKALLELDPGDAIVAFLYIGTADRVPPLRSCDYAANTSWL